jgi:hypothetical protein
MDPPVDAYTQTYYRLWQTNLEQAMDPTVDACSPGA